MAAVEVYDALNTTLGANLSTSGAVLAADAQDRVNEDGTVSVSIPSDHAEAAELAPYNVLRLVGDDSTDRMAGYIDTVTTHVVDEDEHAGEIVEARATGLLGLWDEAVVEPWVGVGRLPFSQDRVFNVASPVLDRSSWTSAVVQSRAYAVAQGLEFPIGWTPDDADWIWSTTDSETQDVGRSPFHTTLTLADAEDIVFLISADNDYELWVDGVLLDRSPVRQPGYVWWDTWKAPLRLPAGTHDIVIIGENWSTTGSANPAAVILAAWTTDGQQLVDNVLNTSTSWDCLHLPDPMPGFNPGQIVDQLLDEAQTRGALTGWTLSFDGTSDSNSDAWPDNIPEFTVRVGSTYRQVLRQLSETWVDVWADTEGLVLHMAAKSTGGRSQTSAIDLQPADNLLELSRTVTV